MAMCRCFVIDLICFGLRLMAIRFWHQIWWGHGLHLCDHLERRRIGRLCLSEREIQNIFLFSFNNFQHLKQFDIFSNIMNQICCYLQFVLHLGQHLARAILLHIKGVLQRKQGLVVLWNPKIDSKDNCNGF